jgi:predicted DNA-binding transcriptional regulator YafY
LKHIGTSSYDVRIKLAESARRKIVILGLLPRYPKSITTKSIKNRLYQRGINAPLRMVQRDLDTLTLDYPLTCDDSTKPFKWSWMKDAQGELFPSMDPIHAFTLSLAVEHLKTLLPKSSLSRIESYFQLAHQTLSNEDQVKLKNWLRKVKIFPRGQPLMAANIRKDVENVIYDSLLNDKKFEALYIKKSAKKSARYIISPLGLVSRSSVHYLVCILDKDPYNPRWLPLHRFTKAVGMDELVAAPKDFNLNLFLEKNSLGFLMSNNEINLELVFTKQSGFHLMETPLNKEQKINNTKDGKLRVRARVADTSELRFWISGFGADVEVIKPQFLREEFIQRSKKYKEMYL